MLHLCSCCFFPMELGVKLCLCFCSLMWKAALVCFLMTLQHIGIEFSHRVETDGQALWCMANWEMKTCTLRNGPVHFLSSNVTTQGPI